MKLREILLVFIILINEVDKMIEGEKQEDACAVSTWIGDGKLKENCKVSRKWNWKGVKGYKVTLKQTTFEIKIYQEREEDIKYILNENAIGFICNDDSENKLGDDYTFENIKRFLIACVNKKYYASRVSHLEMTFDGMVLKAEFTQLHDLPLTLTDDCKRMYDTVSFLCCNIPVFARNPPGKKRSWRQKIFGGFSRKH